MEITSQTIKEETAKDRALNEIVTNLKRETIDSEYTLLDRIFFRKDRTVISETFRYKILNEFHKTHLGITKMKQLVRHYVHWPAFDRGVEELVKECRSCGLATQAQQRYRFF